MTALNTPTLQERSPRACIWSKMWGPLLSGNTHAQDALTKTIPIWAAVVNRAVHIHRSRQTCPSCKGWSKEGWDLGLHLPAWISVTEMSQIETRLDGWAQDLLQVNCARLAHSRLALILALVGGKLSHLLLLTLLKSGSRNCISCTETVNVTRYLPLTGFLSQNK